MDPLIAQGYNGPMLVLKLLLGLTGLDGGASVASTVRKIAHHGSETSSTSDFVAAMDPDFVIVRSGRKCLSRTHIPDMTTLRRYCDHNPNVRIFRTD